MIKQARQRLADAFDRRFEALHHRVERLSGDVGGGREELAALRSELAALRTEISALEQRLDDDVLPALRIMAGRDSESRRLLAEARADAGYERAYDEPEPLVTVILPTYERAELLASRSLPAVLAQSHERLEVLVIGDGPDEAAEQVVREAGDKRVRWTNVSQRYVYPDPYRHWLAISTLTRNEGYRLATGRWLFDFDDDDSLPTDTIETLLAVARARRAEAVQGVLRSHRPDGSHEDIHGIVPDKLPLKGALVHGHLRFFEREHVASALGAVGDWFRGERMVRAGVRIELLDRVTYDYYPSTLWLPRGQ